MSLTRVEKSNIPDIFTFIMADAGYKIRDQYAIHFLTLAVVEGVYVFARSIYSDIIVESLAYCQQNKGLNIHAWCIMSNHVHLIVSSNEPIALSEFYGILKNTHLVRL